MARPRSDIDTRVRRAAAQRFLRDGVDGASLREIARDAGTSVGMVSYYFPTKDDLFTAVVEGVYVGVLRDLTAALAPEAPFEEKVQRLHARLSALTEEEFLVVRLVMREVLVSSPRTPALLARFSRGHIPLLLSTVGEAFARGELRPDVSPLAVALSLATTTLGVQLVARMLSGSPLLHGQALDPGDLADAVRDALFRGIAPRS
ncbi:MAG: TetR/AcrR family transcriptional regulator [Polyangiales bacterium]